MKNLWIALLLCCITVVAKSQELPSWKITEVEKYIATAKNEVLVINFWATFCKPCVAEIPFFISVKDSMKNDGISLLLVSLDLPSFYPDKIQKFAHKQQFTAPIVWLNETNADYFCPKISPQWSGSIPATLIVNTRTGYRAFYEEEMQRTDLESAIKAAKADGLK